uniref:Natterin-4 n=1 Tax=Oreochromis aureus TaxID=47969 RepID=A0A668UDW2_OREAU
NISFLLKLSLLLLLALSSVSPQDITWNGSLPDGAVGASNYLDHAVYVCKYGCEAGFYSSSLGDFCHYPIDGKEQRTSSFDILVNENNFESLDWKEGSNGSVYEYVFKTCSSDEFYIGKTWFFGLGKVHPGRGLFYFLLRGTEHSTSDYEVLTINRDIDNELISHVTYKTNDAKIIRYPPSIIRVDPISNNRCNPVTKTVTLSKTVLDDKWWDLGTGIPNIVNGAIEVSTTDSILDFTGVPTKTEPVNHSVKVQVSIPPNHFCIVKMLAYKYDVNMPFTALLSRIYRKFRVKEVHISGTYHGLQVGEVRAVVERCAHLSSAQPCP